MGGHGGLNILPQKRWNVYNYENREKVRRDEEAAAKEEQLKREQSRKRDTEFRLEKLRQARGLSSRGSDDKSSSSSLASVETESVAEPSKSASSDSKHMNLFEGIRIFDPIHVGDEKKKNDNNNNRNKKVKREEEVRVVGPEDEKYRMGYGVAGKGVKLPWYLEKKRVGDEDNNNNVDDEARKSKEQRKNGFVNGQVQERWRFFIPEEMMMVRKIEMLICYWHQMIRRGCSTSSHLVDGSATTLKCVVA
ncbi:hypothetical protein BUALT_BualtUnG0027100 [Buddleja alternifolia]|uniref:CBF1-interacting co-repressor CIR N-terminal domain-containing protein n=1 Tax=Buddleja alternifolia TaxID=168488 RepID=A0AAV6W7I5_9LAMI|nr:hypothetical protein BUALT_BualtUnG0027100 [Buddleja alternifolia]